MNRNLTITVVCLCALAMSACATRWTGSDYWLSQPVATEPDERLSGEALVQQKQTLRRIQRDLTSIHTTAQSLRRHRDLEGIVAFETFVHPFFDAQVDPQFDAAAPSHPELRGLQANVLFAKAAVLIELRDTWRLSRLRRQIERAFPADASMLVEYPPGQESTLGRALQDLERGRGLL